MSVSNIFHDVKGFKKEDLKIVVEELGLSVPASITISGLKDIILNSAVYKEDAEFVKEILATTVEERKQKFELENEEKARQFELEKKRLDNELELARISQRESSDLADASNSRRKYTLPKIQFRQFGDDLKDWLPFWSQFQHIDKDEEIAAEDKFQYLIQATIVGSRAREVIESFPPTGDNYKKAVESLKSRFGREDLLVEVYVRELIKLIISVQTKGNFSLTSLYDKLESNMRALETLGVTTDKCGSILYPMVESCFPEDFLKAWNRNNASGSPTEAKERLNNLMAFLKIEVEGEERISLAMKGFGLRKDEDKKTFRVKKQDLEISKTRTPTAAGLLTTATQEIKKSCVFCGGRQHSSPECFSAQKMSLTERKNVLKEKGCCFLCLHSGHRARFCRVFLKCVICGKKHVPLMCEALDSKNKETQKKDEIKLPENEVTLSNINKSPKVFLQTLKVKLISDSKIVEARAILDSGSQRSYILKDLATKMGYISIREETMNHSLFGGVISEKYKHQCYRIRLSDLNESFRCNFEVLDQTVICENVIPVSPGSWLEQLHRMKINLTDLGEKPEPIHILIGADVLGRLMTGQRKVLSSGLVAMETFLGWTLFGKVPQEENDSSSAMLVTSFFVKEANISDLWELDLIGIKDPIEKLSKEEQEHSIKESFFETLKYTNEGRYEVHLPWRDDCVPLPNNFELAERRLHSATTKLLSENLYEDYEKILMQWLDEGIIEEVPSNEIKEFGNYLPHRPVIKESSSTTRIRPVFDASARMKGHPSLNQCLHSGPNLIELIPDILLRFRIKRIGVTADIRKAFLQISICKRDRDFLRFLWWKTKDCKELKVFRHTRVVFGVTSSPFLLSAVLDYHIKQYAVLKSSALLDLSKSFYVDNLVTGVDNEIQLKEFMSDVNDVMKKGGFELRDWTFTSSEMNNLKSSDLLGLQWDTHLDVIALNLDWLEDIKLETITKRTMLSIAHRLFDPFGLASPVILCPKLMLQKAWKMSLGWDEEIKGSLLEEFLQWFKDLKVLNQVKVPRWVKVTPETSDNFSLHVFCDASKDAYAAVAYLVHHGKCNDVFLLFSKSRIAPLKRATIPRLELLAAALGVRLANSITNAFEWQSVKSYFWSDSTTVLTWIARDENWSVFVKNRIDEIRKYSLPLSWGYIQGEENPADLPSRGCKATYLVKTRWWEGPIWMKNCVDEWPCTTNYSNIDEKEINQERRKTICLFNKVNEDLNDWYYKYFSSYEKIVRLVGWILRFKNNCLIPKEINKGELTAKEYQEAENRVIKMIQKESFLSEKDTKLKTLETFRDKGGIIRLKTKIINRKDYEDFLYPVVLPAQHEVVKRLILNVHIKNCHAGVQILMNIIREKYWILNCRRTIRSVLSKCVVCRRYNSKNLEAAPASLPEDRVRDAAVFQITGVDMAGPLFIKGNKKCWVLLFTCANYRAVHFELVTSASTDSFLMALRRFIARRGRPTIIYSDNGTNFTGAVNYLKSVDWNRIHSYSASNSIQWKFNPPTASWWGGWWERLIRILKDLLKRVLGKACLSHEEMVTVLVDCERVVNARPLTYISEQESLTPLSPSMFLQDVHDGSVPDIDNVEQRVLNRRFRYRQTLHNDLRKRFRSEYLGALVQKPKRRTSNTIQIGQVVIIGSDNHKRIDWPLGVITEVIPGKDKQVRLVKVKTSHSTLLRPIQRIYPLEIDSSKDIKNPCTDLEEQCSQGEDNLTNPRDLRNISKEKQSSVQAKDTGVPYITRSGRSVKVPERQNL